jgi:hypothetical protein
MRGALNETHIAAMAHRRDAAEFRWKAIRSYELISSIFVHHSQRASHEL